MNSELKVFLAWWLLLLACASPATAAAKPEPGSELFTNGPVLRFKIEIDKAGMDSLRKDPRKFVRAKITEGANVFTDVAAHIKGAAGSTRGVDDKPALTLSFGKFTPDQKFHGLRKIHLNNSVQDASYSTEYLCGLLFHEAGVPAARVTHARVWLNGRDLGFYVVKEGFTKEFLSRYFADTKGTIYDGGFLRDVTEPLEIDYGDEKGDRADLKALAAAAQEPDPVKRWARLDAVLDLDRFISFMAMEILTYDWDGYPLNRNNYRIYHDPKSGKLVFIPHGMDQMFWQADAPLRPNFGGLVANAVVQTPEGRRLYRERLGVLFTNVFKLEVLTNRLQQLAARNRPALAEISAGAAREFDAQTAIVRDRVTQRWQGVLKQLSLPEPKPLAFQQGVAKPGPWRVMNELGGAKLEEAKDADGKPTLTITALGPTTGSWRSRVLLEGGRYRFEGLARTKGVSATSDPQKGEGVGLRISGIQSPRGNKLAGDAPWTKLAFEFDVAAPGDEVDLVCELRAVKGQVWFDAASLQLVKVK